MQLSGSVYIYRKNARRPVGGKRRSGWIIGRARSFSRGKRKRVAPPPIRRIVKRPAPAPVAKARPAPAAKARPVPVAKPRPVPVAKPRPMPVAKPRPAPVPVTKPAQNKTGTAKAPDKKPQPKKPENPIVPATAAILTALLFKG